MLKEKCVRSIPSTSPLLMIAFLAALLISAFAWTGQASAHSLGGGDPVVSTGLAAVSQDSGAAIGKHVFYRGSNGHLWMSATSEPGVVTHNTKWSAPTDLGGVQLASAPTAVSRNANRIDVFYVGPNGHLWTSWWDGSQSIWWSAPTDLGGVQLASAPAAVSRNANRIDVFYVGPNGDLWTSWWDGSQSIWWSAPTDLGGVQLTSAPAARSQNANRIDVYYRGPNGDLWTSWWDGSQSIWWSAPTDLGGVQLTSAPATARWFDSEVYYRGPDGDLWLQGHGLKVGVQLASAPAATFYSWTAPSGFIGGGNGVDVYYGDTNGHLWIRQVINTQGTIGDGFPVDLGKVDFT